MGVAGGAIGLALLLRLEALGVGEQERAAAALLVELVVQLALRVYAELYVQLPLLHRRRLVPGHHRRRRPRPPCLRTT